MRVLIVDDEPLARKTARLVLAGDPGVEVVGDCSGVDAARAIGELAPDLVLLDVQMPEVDGFDVIAAVGLEAMPPIVFVTAYDQYAVRAFEVQAVDYVLKPFDDRRLLAAIARAKERRPAGDVAALVIDHERARPIVQRFVVRGRDKTVFVDARTVDCIEAADDYVELHVGKTVHLLRERLSDLETRLDPARFVRIHRGTIVNLERVRELHPLVRGDALVVLEGGASFRLSRTHRDELMRRMAGSALPDDGSPHPG
jgi:two-component system LytT family response regulator